jgi:hypothetical protein
MTKRAQIGMAMFLIAETVFFSLLIGAFKYFAPPLLLPSRVRWLSSFVLLAASLFAWCRWRWADVAMGVAFLVGLSVTGSSPLTVVHGLHIFAGAIGSAIVPPHALRVMALYWLFFSVVWIAMVTL